MTRFLTGFTRDLDRTIAARHLARSVEEALGSGESLAGGLLLATAASGDLAAGVMAGLSDRWPESHWSGSSFEGLVSDGRVFRDEPALALLAWTEGAIEPVPFVLPPGVQDADRLESEIFDAAESSSLSPDDLVLLFPDAVASLRLEQMLTELGPRLAPADLAGAAASGVDGHPAWSHCDEAVESGSMIGLFLPAGLSAKSASLPDAARVRVAEGTEIASPWLEITNSRDRWVDGLDDEPALDWVRRQLGLEPDASIEGQLGRLLIRVRRRCRGAGGLPEPIRDDLRALDFSERYVVGLDEGRGAFALPGPVRRGDLLAFALPDPGRARERLRGAIDRLGRGRVVLQFACRTRDASLHGDPDVESAWSAHHAPGRLFLGTVSPFQLVSDPPGGFRLLVHSTVLAAVGD